MHIGLMLRGIDKRGGTGVYARAVILEAPSSLWWDQVALPRYARQNGVDLLFDTKFWERTASNTFDIVRRVHGGSGTAAA